MQREIDRHPSRQARKAELYTAEHRALRLAWQPLVDAGQVDCHRCGQPIEAGASWDLGHIEHEQSRPEHPTCNRADGARLANLSKETR